MVPATTSSEANSYLPTVLSSSSSLQASPEGQGLSVHVVRLGGHHGSLHVSGKVRGQLALAHNDHVVPDGPGLLLPRAGVLRGEGVDVPELHGECLVSSV